MIELTKSTVHDLFEHAKSHAPFEVCGVVVMDKNVQRFVPCKNLSTQQDRFIIDPKDWADAEDAYDIIAVAHSHVNYAPTPSPADKMRMAKGNLPWVIINVPTGRFTINVPEEYDPPYTGRVFVHGIIDCYTLIRDYYRREYNILLDDFDREDEWWLHNQNLYTENFASQGFVDQGQFALPQVGDVILMQVGSPVPNHGAIYFGNNQILHHLTGKVSNKTVYGGYWRKSTTHILRHKSKL